MKKKEVEEKVGDVIKKEPFYIFSNDGSIEIREHGMRSEDEVEHFYFKKGDRLFVEK